MYFRRTYSKAWCYQ